MSIDKVMAIKTVGKLGTNTFEGSSFKAVMNQKRGPEKVDQTPIDAATKLPDQTINFKNVVNGMVKNHEVAMHTMKTFMARADYSPERLLDIQYKSGMLFLREQMYCKTAESSANAFKNFTQMQV